MKGTDEMKQQKTKDETIRPSEYIGPNGEELCSKPEGLTHLYGNQLTEKDNPVIVFRGKLDTLCAMILEAQLLGEEKGNRDFVNDLQEILEFTRSLLPVEYKCTPLGEFHVLGFSPQELREQSYNPKKYFGHDHLLMHHSMGALSLRMNLLRTAVREIELTAVTMLRDSSDTNRRSREEIVEALNRLSSLFYILIYKYLPKNYSPAGNAGI
jgi:ethanolamine utilization cobalamin adenosyltransferase